MIFLLLAVLGLIIGSFLNAYVWRLKNGHSVWRGRSICPDCRHKLRAVELVPLLSFLWQRGKCVHCHGKISWQYPLVEFSLAVLFVLVTYLDFRSGFTLQTRALVIWFRDLFLVSVFLGIFVFDLRYYLIPDQFTLPPLIIVFLINWWLGHSPLYLVLGALIGFGFFGIQFAISRGRWVGGGDLRLGALMGVAVGWPLILVALFLAYISGSLVAAVLLSVGRKTWKSSLPFGTFLSLATVFTLFFGNSLLNWYLNIVGY